MKTQIVYTGENATHEWLCVLAQQPGSVWIENRNGQTVIVHEFEDLNYLRGREFSEVIIEEELT